MREIYLLMSSQIEKQKVSIVIPVYNEEQSLAEVLDQVCLVELDGLVKEIIISDDGSTDKTPQIITQYAENATEIVKVHTSPTNLGKGAAVRLGISQASGDMIIIQDADLELSPKEYMRLLRPIMTGQAAVVYGSRFAQRENRIPRRTRLANWFLTKLTNVLFRARLTDMETAYKAFRREAVTDLKLRCVRFDFEPEVTAKLLLAGYQIHEVPISYTPRTVAEGKKISWIDGIEAIYTLLRCRFLDK
jgi:glycosyltransferase involved in cell wall biosynthesis